MLSLAIRAKNSNGLQYLHLTRENNKLALTLTGKYKGEEMQIDFDAMTDDDISDLTTFLNSRKPAE